MSTCPVCGTARPSNSFAAYALHHKDIPESAAMAEYSAILAHSLRKDAIQFQVCRCTACGHLFKTPTFTAEEVAAIYSVDQMAATQRYYELYRRKADPGCGQDNPHVSGDEAVRRYEKWHAQWIYEKVERSSRPEPWVLDFGGAEGCDLMPFSQNGWNVAICDCSSVKPRLEPCHLFRSMEQIHQEFDVVLSAHTFEHLIEPRKTLSQLASLLKEGGSILLEVPYEIPALLHGTMPCVWHLQFFSRNSVAELLTRCGFEVRRVETVRGSYRGVDMYLLVATGKQCARRLRRRRGSLRPHPLWDVLTSEIRFDLCKRGMRKLPGKLLHLLLNSSSRRF